MIIEPALRIGMKVHYVGDEPSGLYSKNGIIVDSAYGCWQVIFSTLDILTWYDNNPREYNYLRVQGMEATELKPGWI